MRFRKPILASLAMAVVGGLVAGGAVVTSAVAAPSGVIPESVSVQSHTANDEGWVTAWAQSIQRKSGIQFNGRTIRQISRVTAAGDQIRLRMQNTFGDANVQIPETTVARTTNNKQPAVVPGSVTGVTFNGQPNLTLAPGQEVWSDPIAMEVSALEDVVISFQVTGNSLTSLHDRAGRTNWHSPDGTPSAAYNENGAPFTTSHEWNYIVGAVDVLSPDTPGTLVAFGSSVVDGTGSEVCRPICAPGQVDNQFGNYNRWADVLARRVQAELPEARRFAIANAGIGGTVSGPACGGGGLDGLSRVGRDVLALHGVRAVIYYYGTNDIANNCSAEDIMAAMANTFQQLRTNGIKIFVTPITPRPGYSGIQNNRRGEVNAFVRTGGNCSGLCDGVLDFDAVLKDPAQPNRIYPDYDYDSVHANIAGQRAIGESIDLELLAAETPTLTTTTLPNATVGVAYDATIAAAGYPAPTYSITAGALPAGLSLDSEAGRITGTPTAAGPASLTISATNRAGIDTRVFEINAAKSNSSVQLTLSSTSAAYGTTLNAAVTVSSATTVPTGLVQLRAGNQIVGTTALRADAGAVKRSSAQIVVPTAALSVGSQRLTVSYAGDTALNASNATSAVTITKAKATVKAKIVKPKKLTTKKRGKVNVTVQVPGVVNPGGKVVVRDGKRKVGSAKVNAKGKAKIKLKKLKAGKRTLKVQYNGSNFVAKATAIAKVKVKRR